MPRIKADTLDAHHELIWRQLLAAFEALSIERGPDKTTLSDVAARAGISRATIYNYVKDKDELAAAAAQHATQATADVVLEIARSTESATAKLGQITQVVLHALQAGSARAALTRELRGSTPNHTQWRAPFAEVFGEVERVINEGVESQEFSLTIEVELAVDFLGGILGAGATRIARGDTDIDRLIDAVTGAMLRVLRN